MKSLIVNFIPQTAQRIQGQVGDYFETEGAVVFRITRFENPAYSFAVLLHELHERFRNLQFDIRDEEVDAFDLKHPELDDPGLDPRAPYHACHMEADALERLFILLTGNDWIEYEAAIAGLVVGEK